MLLTYPKQHCFWVSIIPSLTKIGKELCLSLIPLNKMRHSVPGFPSDPQIRNAVACVSFSHELVKIRIGYGEIFVLGPSCVAFSGWSSAKLTIS